MAALNARVASYNAASQRFNQQVARYRMMMDNPDGLDVNTSIQNQSELTPRQ